MAERSDRGFCATFATGDSQITVPILVVLLSTSIVEPIAVLESGTLEKTLESFRTS